MGETRLVNQVELKKGCPKHIRCRAALNFFVPMETGLTRLVSLFVFPSHATEPEASTVL
jgi:hypothetical protein